MADVRRGVTTNCDDFFIVTDITDEVLGRDLTAADFLSLYGVRRTDVASARYRIVRRGDGVDLPLDASLLVPTLRTARDVTARCTSVLRNDAFAVRIPETRSTLSRLAEAYVRAGEREHWHESASFGSRSDWYVLRDTSTAPILFVKTIQYVPQVFWNDARLLANQRLYNIEPHDGVDAEVLCALLNSTLFAAERFAGVKALGREAANDVEVFTARQLRLPNIRRLDASTQRQLREAFRRLRKRNAGPLVEATLLDAGLHEARVYADQHAVSEAVWPDELRDPSRQEIDVVLLRGLGFSEPTAQAARRRLYDELLVFTRRARLLELEAQVNRRGRSSEGATVPQLADDVWADLTERSQAIVRILPNDFLQASRKQTSANLPPGRVTVEQPDLFSGSHAALRFGRDHLVQFTSEPQRDLALLLAENRVRGEVMLPSDPADCRTVAAEIHRYLQDLMPKLGAAAAEIT
jgi:hypothetical protein